MLQVAAQNNLTAGTVGNCCYVTSKARKVSILNNTMNSNDWIRQPLIAAKMFEVELHQ